jgi:formylmethanofuran dehydrogenase subunit C
MPEVNFEKLETGERAAFLDAAKSRLTEEEQRKLQHLAEDLRDAVKAKHQRNNFPFPLDSAYEVLSAIGMQMAEGKIVVKGVDHVQGS